MKKIEINGVELYVLTTELAKLWGWHPDFEWDNGYCTLTYLSWEDKVKLAGMDPRQTDSAKPQAWLDAKREEWRKNLGQEFPQHHYVWNYENVPTFGEPINVYARLRALGNQVKELASKAPVLTMKEVE